MFDLEKLKDWWVSHYKFLRGEDKNTNLKPLAEDVFKHFKETTSFASLSFEEFKMCTCKLGSGITLTKSRSRQGIKSKRYYNVLPINKSPTAEEQIVSFARVKPQCLGNEQIGPLPQDEEDSHDPCSSMDKSKEECIKQQTMEPVSEKPFIEFEIETVIVEMDCDTDFVLSKSETVPEKNFKELETEEVAMDYNTDFLIKK